MLIRKTAVLLVLFAVALFANGANFEASVTQDTASVPKTQDDLVIGEHDAKQLLLLIGPNKEGKITKQAWMKFMAAEFDRLDKDKSGALDVKELAQSKLRVRPFSTVGK